MEVEKNAEFLPDMTPIPADNNSPNDSPPRKGGAATHQPTNTPNTSDTTPRNSINAHAAVVAVATNATVAAPKAKKKTFFALPMPAYLTSKGQQRNQQQLGDVRPNKGPPIRFDKNFHYYEENRRKMLQLATGAFCFLLTKNCYPNIYADYCTGELFSLVQLFLLIGVIGISFCATAALLLCSMFSLPDAFYNCDFQFVEKFFTTMATSLYGVGAFGAALEMYHARFSFLWPFQLAFVLAALVAYAIDCWQRWAHPKLR